MKTADNTQQEVRELRALVETLQAETTRLSQLVDQPSHQQNTTNQDSTLESNEPEPIELITDLSEHRTSRRNMFKAGAAVAAAAVATPMLTKTAAAADGGNMIIGGNNTSAGGHTRLNSTGAGLLSNQNIFTVTDQQATSQYPAAIGAVAQGDRVTNGMYAYTESREDSSTSTGHALVVRSAFGSRSHIYMPSGGSTPTFDTYAHARGEMRSTGGNLWFCTGSGTPGTWRKITGPTASGAVHAISPRRAYDSRFIDGPIAGGGSRIVSLANSIDVSTGGNTGTLVPANATAVFFNLAIVNTTGVGWLSVAPGTATSVTASTINWSSAGVVLANGSMSTIDTNRQVRVFAGPGGTANFIIDITGYTL